MRFQSLAILTITILLTLVPVAPVLAQAGQTNPFVKSERPVAHGDNAETPETGQPGPAQNFLAAIINLQQSLNKLIADLVRAVQPGGEAFHPVALLALMGISFLYGIVHALGPGHGKAIASSFFLARPARIRNGIELGYWLALIHAIVAIGLVFLLSQVLRFSIGSGTEIFSWWLGTVSYSLVVAIGVFMLADALVQLASGGQRHLHLHFHAGNHDHDHGHDHQHDHQFEHDHDHEQEHELSGAVSAPPAMVRSRELVALGFISAVVPCPGAIGIMVFATGAGAMATGALAVASLSLGMGLTSSVAGIAGILTRRGVLKAGQAVRPAAVAKLGGLVRIAGSLLFATLGTLLLLAQFH